MIKVSNELMDNWNVILDEESIYNAYLSGNRHNSDCFLLSNTYYTDIQLNITNLQLINGVLYADINEVEGLPMNVERVNVEDGHLIAYYREGLGKMSRVDLGIVVGPKGDTGNTPDISVGIVTTGNPGTNASVNIGGTKEEPVLNFTIPRGNTGEVSEEELDTAVKSMASPVYDNANGDIVTFDDGAKDVLIKSLLATIKPVQSGSGDPSPTNIRPISGRTGMTVTRAGKNLCGELLQGYWAFADGTAVTSDTWVKTPKIRCKGSTTYTASSDYESHWMGFLYYDQNGAFISTDNRTGQTKKYTSTSPANAAYMAVNINAVTSTTVVTPEEVTSFQLEESAAQTAYEPYKGQTYPITWESIAGTVYGGTLDVVSGVLTVDKAIATLNGTNYPVGQTGSSVSNPVLIQAIVPNIAFVDASDSTKITSDYLPSTSDNAIYENANLGVAVHYAPAESARRIWMRLPGITTEADAKTYLASNPLTVVYPIITPQTYQLTPTDVRTILGGNTIYTDAGDVSVEYVADTGIYIDNSINKVKRLIAGIETTYVASRNYNVGDFIVVNNDLLKVISAIASGETIVIGANANITTVAEQLILLFNS